jgi:excisionase family DNA binding protein
MPQYELERRRREHDGRSLLRVGELAGLLQVSAGTVYRLIREGRLPAVRVGGQWRFRREDCEGWLDGRPCVQEAEVQD